MSTPTALDLPGRTPTWVRLAVCAMLIAAVGGTGAYWADARAEMVAGGAATLPSVVVPLAVALAAAGAWLVVHRRRGREPSVEDVGAVHAPPSDHTPAEVGWLLRYGSTTIDDLAATLIDLVDDGHLTIDLAAGTIAASGDAPAAPEQRVVVEWLRSGPPTVAHRTARITANPGAWQQFWWRFCDTLSAAGRRDGLVERAAAAEEILSVGLLSSSVMVAGAVGMARGYPAWLACVAAGAVILVFADTLARRSLQGAQLAARWRAFCSHLSATPAARAAHLAHAVALDVDVALTAEQRFLVEVVTQWQRAYVTASAFLSGPTARLRARGART